MNTGQNSLFQLPDGRVMGYAEYGQRDGFPLLVLHGTPGSRYMFQPGDEIAQSRGLRLIAPDRPGYGLSSVCIPTQYHQWTQDIKCLLEALNVERFLVFGVSGGGPFATAVASSMPEKIRGLALVSPVGIFDQAVCETWRWQHKLLFHQLPRFPFIMKFLFQLMRLFIFYLPHVSLKVFIQNLGKADQLILKEPIHTEQLIDAFHEGLRFGVDGVCADVQLFSSPWKIALKTIRMPVCLWQGMDDHMVPPKGALRLAECLPNVDVFVLEGEGHFWILNHFEDVLDQLLTTPD